MKKILSLVLVACFLWTQTAYAALTKGVENVTDWNACAQNTVEESTVLDTSDHYATEICVQAFLDTTTAHTGTEFIVQVSSNTTGDEDWHDYNKFVALIDTANSENSTGNPLAAGSTTVTVADTGGNYEDGPIGSTWIAFENATLANSELVLLTGYTTDTNFTCLDGTANEHVQNTVLYDVAISRTVIIGFPVNRVRVVINNAYDDNGSTLNYRVRATSVTAI
jgi:hypothetical protein